MPKPPPETPPYSSSETLSRRQFLQAAAGILTAAAMPLWPAFAAPARPAYFCRLNLQSGELTGHGGSCPSGEPGSLMKMVTASALLESNRLTPDETFNCRGVLVLHGIRFRCQKAHGKLTLNEALGQSCNLFFVQASERLTSAQWITFARRWGLDDPLFKKTAHRFPDTKHLLPHSQLYSLGLTQELQPDAWQLLRMAALTARQGKLSASPALRLPDPGFSPSTWQMLQSGMRRAVRTGTAIGLDADNQWHAAAKTGTTPHGKSYQSWVIGYYPFEAPTTAFCLRAFEGTGKDRAVPLARKYLKDGWQ